MLHELIGLKNNRVDLGKAGDVKINIESKDFNMNDLKVMLKHHWKIKINEGIRCFMSSRPFLQ